MDWRREYVLNDGRREKRLAALLREEYRGRGTPLQPIIYCMADWYDERSNWLTHVALHGTEQAVAVALSLLCGGITWEQARAA